MFSKCKVLVLLIAFGVLAGHEAYSPQSAPFSFLQVGVTNPYSLMTTNSSFSCKKIASGKEGILFSWSLPGNTAKSGNLSVFSISGKLLKTFNLTSRDNSKIWNIPHDKLAGGVYFAVLTYGMWKKNTKIVY